MQEPDPSTLTSEYLIRNASVTSLDSSITLLSVTTVALADVETEYARWTYVLIKFMKYHVTVIGNPEEEEVLDMIVQTRYKINELKQKRRDLTLLYQTVVAMVSSAAEAALIAGVDYQVSSANEAMQGSQTYIRSIQNVSQGAERELTDVQVETIAKESKHAEEEEATEKREQESESQKTHGELENELPENDQKVGEACIDGGNHNISGEQAKQYLDLIKNENDAKVIDSSSVKSEEGRQLQQNDRIFAEDVKYDADEKIKENDIFLEEITKDKYDTDQ